MPSARILQTNFTSGELSPRVFGRSDLRQYANGAAELRNMVVLPAGGATRRSGSQLAGFLATAASGTPGWRLIPFIVSNIAAYTLELGDQYIVFRRNRGHVIGPTGLPVTLPTPWLGTELRGLRFRQSVDVLYVTHPSHAPQKITRTSANTFTIGPVPFEDGPYGKENTGDIGATGTVAAPSAPDSGVETPPPLGGSGEGSGSESSGNSGVETPADHEDAGNPESGQE